MCELYKASLFFEEFSMACCFLQARSKATLQAAEEPIPAENGFENEKCTVQPFGMT